MVFFFQSPKATRGDLCPDLSLLCLHLLSLYHHCLDYEQEVVSFSASTDILSGEARGQSHQGKNCPISHQPKVVLWNYLAPGAARQP